MIVLSDVEKIKRKEVISYVESAETLGLLQAKTSSQALELNFNVELVLVT